MENKYYTPTLEEFHVGFEFEKLIYTFEFVPDYLRGKSYYDLVELSKTDCNIKYIPEWISVTANHNISDSVLWLYLPFRSKSKKDFKPEGNLRVKYLDETDLTNIGFTNVEFPYEACIQSYIKRLDRLYIHLNYTKFTDYIIISIDCSVNVDSVKTKIVHSIRIKNKSELVDLLKKLNLYE